MILKPQHSKGARLLFCWIIFGILALLAMIRAYTVGIDTPQFIGAYQDIGFNSSFSLNQYRYEPGFTILCKLLNYVNKEGKCWLSISDVCYSPVMEYCEGKYKNHNFLQKENMFGELFISGDTKAKKLLNLGLQDDHIVKDLSIIKGNYKGIGHNLRHANFSLLRKMSVKIKEKGIVKLCENGQMRYFYPVAMVDMGLNERHSFKYKTRKEFLQSFLDLAKVKETSFRLDKPVIILESKTDVDIVMVLLVEKEVKRNEK